MGNNHPKTYSPEKLGEKDILFLMDNSSFDRDQIYEWHREFLKEAPSGKLKKNQFQKICQAQQDHEDDEIRRYTKYAFQTFDKDKSGYINYIEFILAIAQLSSGDMIGNLLLTFKMYDINGDGTISKRELKRIVKALYKLRGITNFVGDDRPSKRVKMIFEKYDKSKDNRICEKEFLDACLTDPMIRSLLTNV